MDGVDLKDFGLNRIVNYSYENVFLTLSCELKSGKISPVPFEQLRHFQPYETARCIKDKVVGFSRRYFHQKLVSTLLHQRKKSIRRMSRLHSIKKAFRILVRRLKRARKSSSSKSSNSRASSKTMREKFGIKVPNHAKEASFLDKTNGDSK